MVRVRRHMVAAALSLAMVIGIAIYLRLWTIDYRVSSNEAEVLRQQFDLANREAMDESAEWRLKYDLQVKTASKCMQDLAALNNSFNKLDQASGGNLNLDMLRKENAALFKRIEALKKELEAEKLKCKV